MRKQKILILGILSYYPMIYFGIFILIGIKITGPGSAVKDLVMGWAFLFLFLAWIDLVGMSIYCITHLLSYETVPKEKRKVWIVALIFGSPVAIPDYWRSYIRKLPDTL